MIILHITPDLNPGGAELMMQRLIESHRGDPRYEHRVISLRGLRSVGTNLQAQGVAIEALGLRSLIQLPYTIYRLTRRIRSIKPDIVQTWMYHADLFGGLAARAAGCRNVVWGVRIADIGVKVGVSRTTGWVRRACASLSARIPARILYVAESARQVHERLGYDRSKSIVIQNGYNIPPAAPANRATARFRAELDLDGSTLLVGSAGRFNEQKDFRTFVVACAKVADRLPQAHFVIAGRGIDHDNIELLEWIRGTGHEERFHLVGHKNDFFEFVAGLDIFCLHSLQEGFPNVVAEAMAAGIPCAVTNVGDAAPLVDDTGLVVPAANPDLLASALLALLLESPEARAERGARARRRIADHFSMEAIRARYENLYGELVDDPPAGVVASGAADIRDQAMSTAPQQDT